MRAIKATASGSDKCDIKIWDLDREKLKSPLTGHSHCVLSVTFSPNGKILASADFDRTY